MAVAATAAEKCRQGCVRLHGLLSLPAVETKVRIDWACAGMTESEQVRVVASNVNGIAVRTIDLPRLKINAAPRRGGAGDHKKGWGKQKGAELQFASPS